MKIDRRNPHHWLLLAQQWLYTLIATGARRLARRPHKPLVVLYGHQLSGNLKALYQEWHDKHRDQIDCYFLCLDPTYSQHLRQQGINVLQCNRLKDMILAGRCDAMITDHGLHLMGAFMRFTSILFIDVWHGIPFKGFIPDDFRLQHRYDEVWVSSPLLKDIYQQKFGFPPEIVNSIGYARTDKLFRRELPSGDFAKQASIPKGNRIVLYAPTWQQDDSGRELFPFGEKQDAFIEKLSRACDKHAATLVIRSHLNSSISNRNFENVRYCSMKDFPDSEELLQNTDILICDWSSIAFDYLALDRPTVFLDVEPPFKNGFSLGKEYRFGLVVTDMNMLCDALENTLENTHWYTSAYKDTHQDVLSATYGDNTDGKSAERQWSRLAELLQ
ncbi:Teichoic acid ribitol-phosphate polymerase TarK [Halioglobus japonicus]|nr:Teichoic acid ribitol-phosphate polymerase TarK [Halioglobus japonicus]